MPPLTFIVLRVAFCSAPGEFAASGKGLPLVNSLEGYA